MEMISHLRSSFRSRRTGATSHSNSSLNSSADPNNNSSLHRKRTRSNCDLCGKRLLKLVRWRNYFTLPCKCRHVFCKQCITGRLQCRQKVLRSASFDLMWTFPCPGNAQCGQELTVDWSRGSSYSKNLVARDLGSVEESWAELEEDDEDLEEEAGVCNETMDHSDVSDISGGTDHDISVLREIG